MFYELRATIFVVSQDELVDVLDKLDDLKPQMKVVNPDQEDIECSVIDVMKNHHDQSPHIPCVSVSHWDNCPLAP